MGMNTCTGMYVMKPMLKLLHILRTKPCCPQNINAKEFLHQITTGVIVSTWKPDELEGPCTEIYNV